MTLRNLSSCEKMQIFNFVCQDCQILQTTGAPLDLLGLLQVGPSILERLMFTSTLHTNIVGWGLSRLAEPLCLNFKFNLKHVVGRAFVPLPHHHIAATSLCSVCGSVPVVWPCVCLCACVGVGGWVVGPQLRLFIPNQPSQSGRTASWMCGKWSGPHKYIQKNMHMWGGGVLCVVHIIWCVLCT